MKLTTEQLKAINTTESRVLIEACAGSGKTTVLIERIKTLLDQNIPTSELVAITFTNSAAENMRERIGKKLDGMFIGTIHAYANYLLLSSGIDTSNYLNNEDFDKLFGLVKQHPYCIKPIQHLLVDEAQDSTQQQFELFQLLNPKNFFYVFDYRQSIFRWAGADPEYIIDMMRDKKNTVYRLTQNYRNGSSILEYAKSIIQLAGYDYIDDSIPMRETSGRVIRVDFSPDYLVKSISKYGDYKDWFILTRKNQELEDMCVVLKRNNIPFDTFKKAQLTNKEIDSKLKENTVKVLTIHTAKGLEAPNVIVIGQKFYNLEEKCISYVAATRARDLLVWTTQKSKLRGRSRNNTVKWE